MAANGSGGLPLEGIRVIDMTWVAAGPSSMMLFALQGADVIRIEAPDRPELSTFVDNPTKDPNYGPVYQSLNMCKRNISVNLKSAEGIEIVRKLVLTADLLVESMRPGRMKALGIDYDELKRENPKLVMASLSGFGQIGPEAEYGGYAPIFAASGGLSHLTGYPDGIPTEYRGTSDMRTGLSLVVPILAALRRARRTGVGSYIDLAGAETASCVVAEAVIDYQMNGRDRGRVGNDDLVMAPHGAYECRDDQSFLTIACRGGDDWEAIKRVLPKVAALEGFDSGAARWERRRELDQALRPIVRERDREELAAALQAEGVPAVPTMSNKFLYEDAHPHERGVWACVDHPVQGERWAIGVPWTTSRIGRGVDPEPSPLMNQYSREILGELELSDEEIEGLIERGVVRALD